MSNLPTLPIERLIHVIRGHRVMLDRDLARLYEVPTQALNQAVKRHRNRFPEDFMFRLTPDEMENWKSQFVTSNPGARMGVRKPPHVFTEQGVAMLSSVLKSERAAEVNVAIMRAFVSGGQFKVVFDAIRGLMEPPEVQLGPAQSSKVTDSGTDISSPF